MKIFGIGTDIVNISRLEKILKRRNHHFKNKIFTKNEIKYCEKKRNSVSFYAKRFAAKEALCKALGTGIKAGFTFKNIEIVNDTSGKPHIVLKKTAIQFFKKKVKSKLYDIHLSLTDDKPWAQATVIISLRK
jgi:holo-[acyl-carrier protein] synthase